MWNNVFLLFSVARLVYCFFFFFFFWGGGGGVGLLSEVFNTILMLMHCLATLMQSHVTMFLKSYSMQIEDYQTNEGGNCC